MKDFFILFIKGFIIGIGKIIPGVSGAMLAISLNLYEKGLNAITHFFNDIKNNLYFLGSLALGILFSCFFFSKILLFTFNNYYFLSMMLFIGLILGGIFSFIKENFQKEKMLISIISLGLIFFLSILNPIQNKNFSSNFLYLISGIIDAFASIVPGISGTLLLILLGTYQTVLNAVSTINIIVLIFYGMGLFIGIIIFSLLIDYLFKKRKDIINHIIIGLSSSTLIILFIQTIPKFKNIYELFLGILCLTLGVYIANILKE